MPEFNILPESTAPLALQRAPLQSSEYDIVRVLSLGFRRDVALHGRQRGHLAHVFGSFGYEVRSVEMDLEGVEAATGLWAARAGGASFGSQAALEFKRMYDQVESWQRAQVNVCYVGHGVVLRTEIEVGPLELDWIGIPLAAFQRHARKVATNVDTLFVFETCFGGHDRLGRRSADRPLVETLAANDGIHTVASDGCDAFPARFAGTLAHNAKYGVTAWDLSALIEDKTLPHAPGYYWSDRTQNDYDDWDDDKDANYNPESICLLPLGESKAWRGERSLLPLGLLLDAVVPRVALEPAQQLLLASCGVVERRLRLKLARGWQYSDLVDGVWRMFDLHCREAAGEQGEEYAGREFADIEIVLRLLMA